MHSLDISYVIYTDPAPQEKICGDQYLIKKGPDNILIAVADGLGHGEKAASAAKKAMNIIENSTIDSLKDLMLTCHEALKNTRGVVLTLIKIEENYKISYLSVGNIMFLHWQRNPALQSEFLNSFGGIVGNNLPKLLPSQFICHPDDTLIIATDGIQKQILEIKPFYYASLKMLSDHILKLFRNPKDDCLLLVIQWKKGITHENNGGEYPLYLTSL